MKKQNQNKKNYLFLLIGFLVAFIINSYSVELAQIVSHTADASVTQTFVILTLLFGFGYWANRFSSGTIVKSFVVMLLVGLVLQDILTPVVGILLSVVIVFANYILYLGGIEIDRKSFVKIVSHTVLLGVLGYIITAFSLGMFLHLVLGIDVYTSYLLGAILGSTDPAALIPVLKDISFRNKTIPSLLVAESAVNDVIGSVTTTILLLSIKSGVVFDGIVSVCSSFASRETALHLGQELIVGGVIGVCSYGVIHWYERKKVTERESVFDVGILLFVPLFAWTIATFFHGSGFLASFIAGLLALYGSHHNHFEKTSHIMESKVEVYAKPAIFMLLGPLVDFDQLWVYVPQGIIASIAFVCIRIVTVFVTIGLSRKYTFGELLFMGVEGRMTGVIPVVLLIITAQTIPSLVAIVPIGSIVVLFTLIVLPSIAPFVARLCRVAGATS